MENIKFNKSQLEAINHREGACAVIAGAGSGKSTVLVNRIKSLVECGVRQNEIMAISFTDNSAKDLKNKLKDLNLFDVNVGTFHSVCRKILFSEGISTSRMIKSFEAENVFRRVVEKPKTNEILSFISYQKNYGIDVNGDFLEKQSSYDLSTLRELYDTYEKFKKYNSILDFDDWLLEARRIMKDYKNKNPYTYKYILVDEHQDSNLIQNDIIDLLCPSRNIMVVGDYRQCLLPDTKIKTNSGEKSIKDISIDDKLMVGSGRGTISVAKPSDIMTREYEGNIIEIVTKSGKRIECTPNHVIFTNRKINKPYYVYLMYRPEYGFRIGQSSNHLGKQANGFEKRLTDECAEKVWCIEVCNSLEEACYYENYYAFEYGIPLYVFNEKNRKIKISQNYIKKLFNSIDTYSRGHKLLKDKELYFDYPHYIPKGNSKYIGVKVNLTMFGSSRKQKGILNKYNGFNHELSYNTIDKDFYKKTYDIMNGGVFKSKNNKGFEYYMARKSNGNHDHLFNLGKELEKMGEKVIFSQKAIMTENLTKMELYPSANITVGMEVATLHNDTLINDEVVSVTRKKYIGKVYDINVPKYRNYIANGISVHNCIYGFRGSRPEMFMNFHKKYEGAKVINLDINYRSSASIVEGANNFIKKYYSDYEHYSDSKTKSNKQGKVDIFENMSRESEAIKISEMIKGDIENGIKPKDIAVLYRLNQHSFGLENELKKLKIPYVTSAKNSFFKRREINAIVCMLRLIDNPDDDGAFEELFNFRSYPLTFISKKIFENIVDIAARKNMSLFEASEVSKTNKPWERKCIDNFRKIVMSLILQNKRGVALEDLVNNIISLLKIEEFIKEKYYDNDLEERLDSLVSLKKFIRDNSIKSFIKFVYSSNSSSRKSRDEEIQLMTIHKSKGLEFKKTYVIGVEDGKFPHINANEIDEARLFYVAVTRAKENLVISQIFEDNKFIENYLNKIA